MILVFDLDDTLYDEITYVKSGFKAVANYLSGRYNIKSTEIYNRFYEILNVKGRGNIFDEVLLEYGIFSKNNVKKCLSVYRTNKPDIILSNETKKCLEQFNDYTKYVVTDGNKLVQRLKVEALGIDKYFKKCIITHNFGVDKAKPSTYTFHKILKWEKASPHNLIYIADNPQKDFINLKKEGFKTIRVLTGSYKNLRLSEEYEADCKIGSLADLDLKFLNKFINKQNENR